jgi:hypothetical protein
MLQKSKSERLKDLIFSFIWLKLPLFFSHLAKFISSTGKHQPDWFMNDRRGICERAAVRSLRLQRFSSGSYNPKMISLPAYLFYILGNDPGEEFILLDNELCYS